MQILGGLWLNPPLTRPHSVGVILQKIVRDIEVTYNFFDEPRRAALEKSIDRLNRCYGRTTVTHACALKAAQYLSHERLPFGKPWELDRPQPASE